MPRVEAPFVDAKIDTGDLSGSASSVGKASLGVALSLGVFAAGRHLWNRFAEATPDQIQTVEVL